MPIENELHERNLISPEFYARHGYPYAAWERLRRESPVYRVVDWDGPPYWAVTRHEEIVEVSKNPEVYSSVPRVNLEPGGVDPMQVSRNVLTMDPPEHRDYRKLVAGRFTPRSMKSIFDNVDAVAREVIADGLADNPTEVFDFVERISARIPIWVIAEMLGVPRADWKQLYEWTNQSVGASDPEYQQGRSAEETRDAAMSEMFEYFTSMAEGYRKKPNESIVSDLVHARIDGKEIEPFELLSYCTTLLAAGNETTRNAITGGIITLGQDPDQFDRLKSHPEFLDTFVEEVLRYVSPVIQMCRTPLVDVVLAGQAVPAGEPLVMFYPSANRDERVFHHPDIFDMTRDPNPHLAFGIGEHFCLGTHVARLEIRTVFKHLVRCLRSIEIVEPPVRLSHVIVGGIKQLGVRLEIEGGEMP